MGHWTHMLAFLLWATLGVIFVHPAWADTGRIRSACIEADRARAEPDLCACLQRVADQMLTRSDQRLAATFFEDPQRAQDIRMSDNARHEAFWDRYRDFGTAAANICAP